MERNFGAEIDELKKELQYIKELLKKDEDNKNDREKIGHVEKMADVHPDSNINAILNRLENSCGKSGDSGRITYLGVFASGGRQSTWIKNGVHTDDLLTLIENRTAEKVLKCIGNNDRLNILLAILRKPMTVAQIVEKCGFNSTGQAYHHIKPLLAADLIAEDSQNKERGYYIIQPHRVQGIIMLLAGICDMTDNQYTEGNWED